MAADPLLRFEYRMAAHHGYASPSRMLSEMTSEEYTYWLAFHEFEPFGPIQDDYRAGLLATIACRAAGDKKAQPKQFFPSLSGPKQNQDVNQMAAIAKAFATKHNEQIEKRRGRNTKKY